MRFQQLVMESGSADVTLTFHPRLTVISGLGRKEREGVTGELLGVMAGVRRNTRLDLLDDAGRHLSVRRADIPEHDKVVNLDNAHEVSLEFLNGGRVDLLHAMGLDMERARRRWRLSPDDISADQPGRDPRRQPGHPQPRPAVGRGRAGPGGRDPAGGRDRAVGDVRRRRPVDRRDRTAPRQASRRPGFATTRSRQFGLFIGGGCAVAAGSAIVLHTSTGGAVPGRRGGDAAAGGLVPAPDGAGPPGRKAGPGRRRRRLVRRLPHAADRGPPRPPRGPAQPHGGRGRTAGSDRGLAGARRRGVSADWAFAMRDRITAAVSPAGHGWPAALSAAQRQPGPGLAQPNWPRR